MPRFRLIFGILFRPFRTRRSSLHREKAFIRQEEGVTSLEYAVMLSLICGAVISSVGVLSVALKDSFNRSGNAVNRVLGGLP
jgi:Flp pilus assembly pilin Flp